MESTQRLCPLLLPEAWGQGHPVSPCPALRVGCSQDKNTPGNIPWCLARPAACPWARPGFPAGLRVDVHPPGHVAQPVTGFICPTSVPRPKTVQGPGVVHTVVAWPAPAQAQEQLTGKAAAEQMELRLWLSCCPGVWRASLGLVGARHVPASIPLGILFLLGAAYASVRAETPLRGHREA